jgi:hypothetical protein
MGAAQIILPWVIAVLPGCVYFLIWIGYYRILKQKRREIESVMLGAERLALYMKAIHGLKGDTSDPKATVDKLFSVYHGKTCYVVPMIINSILTVSAAIVALTRAGIHIAGVPTGLEGKIQELPPVVIAACAGAFAWGLYDILSKYQAASLSPIALHFVWWRLLVAPVLGYLVSLAFDDALRPLIGFVVGAFPARTLLDYARGVAKKTINLDTASHPVQEPTLDKIQGMTADMIETLDGEGITSTAHLAQADPIKLLLRTSIEWKLILDIIDQAILFNYVEDKIAQLRSIGVRGAIEFAYVGVALEDKNAGRKKWAEKTVESVASTLGKDEQAVRHFMRVLNEDTVVEFIWDLWGEVVPTRGR